MDYMTLKEASEKWGVTPRQINYLCTGGRIPVVDFHQDFQECLYLSLLQVRIFYLLLQ